MVDRNTLHVGVTRAKGAVRRLLLAPGPPSLRVEVMRVQDDLDQVEAAIAPTELDPAVLAYAHRLLTLVERMLALLDTSSARAVSD